MALVGVTDWWRSVKLCGRWQLHVNSLWRWWYCLMALGVHGYLIFRAVQLCKEYNQRPWLTENKPVTELYIYIALIVISVMCIPFIIITAVFKVGNYANDGRRLGRDVGGHLRDEGVGIWQVIWRHSGPFCQGCHLVSTFCLLLPPVLLQAQQIKHGFSSSGRIWNTELDVLFGHVTYSSGEATLQISTTNPLPLRSTTTTPPPDTGDVAPISPEFITYAIIMIVYSISYASVFWYTKMAFSLVFSCILVISNVHCVFSFCSMALLYKFSVNANLVEGDMGLILPPSGIIVLYLLANTVIHFSMIAVFNYGYAHFLEKWKQFTITQFPILMQQQNAKSHNGCHGYVPHTMATIVLVLVVGFRAPIVYDSVLLYREAGFRIVLAGIIVDVAYMIIWVLMWLTLTVKEIWNFRILLIREFEREISETLPTVHTFQNGEARGENLAAENNQKEVDVHTEISSRLDHSSTDPEMGRDPTMINAHKLGDNRTYGSQRIMTNANLINATNHGRSQKRKWEETKSHDNELSQVVQPVNGIVRRVKSDRLPSRDDRLDHESTPESTLTKTYRASVRDRCGQYYYRDDDERMSGDPAPPLSSPRQPDSSYSTEVILKPADLGRGHGVQQRPRDGPPDQRFSRDNSASFDLSMRNIDPILVGDQRRHSANRLSRETTGPPPPYQRHDGVTPRDHPDQIRHSREISPRPRFVPEGRESSRYSRDLSESGNARKPDITRPKHSREIQQIPRYSRDFPENVRLSRESSPGHASGEPMNLGSRETNRPPLDTPGNGAKKRIDFTYQDSVRDDTNPKSQRRDLPPDTTDLSYPGQHIGSTNEVHKLTNLNVKINAPSNSQILDAPPELPPRNKPSLSRRDSALPSSNDTSSNDSHDVLCSQV